MTNPTTEPKHADTAHPVTEPYRYTAQLADEIERRWQQRWDDEQTFRALDPGDDGFDPSQPKFYCLDMFPYPSGTGLHVGHPEGYTATDIISRYKRLQGFNVLHPMGWDAFGLPAEQYAIQTGVHPEITTKQAIETFRRQLKRFGFSYDWAREFATIDEDYYGWTQWIWLKAYQAWYDRDAQRARPISELVEAFESGTRPVGPDPDAPAGVVGGPAEDETFGDWSALDTRARKRILDTYRLAYLSEQIVNWCPKLGTALANEEVIDGRSERGGHPVLPKPLRQWMFRITAFADRLLADLEGLAWPESTRTMQREWIGRSEGAEVDFPIAGDAIGGTASIRIYTTRPDTLFGATYMVLAPEHPLVDAMLAAPRPETDVATMAAYVEQARSRADLDRMVETREKTGVFTGFHAVNPTNGGTIPIWVADYVLMGYGHGAIMAVPGHDQRDFEFAKTFDLPIVEVVEAPEPPPEGTTFSGIGTAINSANDEVSLDGLNSNDAKRTITAWLERRGIGRHKVNFKLRDWLFSRQRYWGEPFPVVFDDEGVHHPVDESALPVKLPALTDYQPRESDEPTPMLGNAKDWLRTTAGEAGVAADELAPDTPVTREANTMPGWAGSCWYYLRYCDPRNAERFMSRESDRYWMLSRRDDATNDADAFDPEIHHRGGVDLYIGGAEHAVLHLLYCRFWHKLLFDLGEVASPEPVGRLFHQGMITSYAYQRADKSLVPLDAVTPDDAGGFVETATGESVNQVVAKMSKSLRNVINPDDVIAEFGADTFRLYEMYMGPLEATKPWNTRDMIGLFRFLQRTWRLFVDESTGGPSGRVDPAVRSTDNETLDRALHRTIAGVTQDIENIRLNTAIAKLIELVNLMVARDPMKPKSNPIPQETAERFLILLAPFAPHVAEELWSRLERKDPGTPERLTDARWPTHDASLLVDDQVDLPVQIMGKVRGRISIAADADEKAIQEAALADGRIHELLEGKTVRKVIVVPGRIVNIITG